MTAKHCSISCHESLPSGTSPNARPSGSTVDPIVDAADRDVTIVRGASSMTPASTACK
jgi:hypothetical protein